MVSLSTSLCLNQRWVCIREMPPARSWEATLHSKKRGNIKINPLSKSYWYQWNQRPKWLDSEPLCERDTPEAAKRMDLNLGQHGLASQKHSTCPGMQRLSTTPG